MTRLAGSRRPMSEEAAEPTPAPTPQPAGHQTADEIRAILARRAAARLRLTASFVATVLLVVIVLAGLITAVTLFAAGEAYTAAATIAGVIIAAPFVLLSVFALQAYAADLDMRASRQITRETAETAPARQ